MTTEELWPLLKVKQVRLPDFRKPKPITVKLSFVPAKKEPIVTVYNSYKEYKSRTINP